MKITLKILGTLLAIVALLASAGGTIRNFRDAGDADSVQAELEAGKAQIEEMKKNAGGDAAFSAEMDKSIAQMEAAAAEIPTKSTFTTAGILCAVLALLSVMLIVFQYVSSQKIATVLLVLTLIVGIMAIVMSPEMKETFTSGASNRTIAMFAGIPAILAAGCAFLISRMKKAAVITA
jgi:hypothetical protein